MDYPKCDRCEKPATMVCVDILRHEAPGQIYVEYSPIPGVKSGCDDHPVKSIEHVTQLPRDKA